MTLKVLNTSTRSTVYRDPKLGSCHGCIVIQAKSASTRHLGNLMFIGPCIIAIIDEWKTNLMSLAILFHLCAQHVSDINISIIRSLRLCWWITTSVVLFSVRRVLELLLLRLVFGGVRFAGWFFITKFICPLKHFIWN